MSNFSSVDAACANESIAGRLDDVNTRDDQRRTCVLPLTAMFIRADGMILDESRSGYSRDVSSSGIEFELSGNEPPTATSIVLGIECPDDRIRFVGVVNRHAEVRGAGLRCGGDFAGIAHRMLSQHGRIPSLDSERFQYAMQFDSAVYESWQAAGILKRIVLDRVLLCPKCHSVPTFRFACRSCGAGRLEHEQLIHHYACAFVGPARDFDTASKASLVCPKCRTKHLAVGTDFEYAPGEFHCQCCGWRDRDLEQTGHCLNCEHRFPIHQSVEQELIGYDVERLDPLALIADLG